MTLRQLLWMTGERKRVMGELAAWQVLAIRAHLMSDSPPTLAELNLYGDGKPAQHSQARERYEADLAARRLRAASNGGNVPVTLTPDGEAAMRILRRSEAAQKVNDAATQAAIRRILDCKRGQ